MGLSNLNELNDFQDNSSNVNQLVDTAANDSEPQQTLSCCVERALTNYLKQLDGQQPSNVYELVMNEVEAPLLKVIMEYTGENQTKASEALGLNRGTLRKKLKQFDML